MGATIIALSAAQRRSEARVLHSREVARLARGLQMAANTRNAMLESYFLTADARFLRADSSAEVALMTRVAELQDVVTNAPQRERLDRLAGLLAQFNVAIDSVVAARPDEDVPTILVRLRALEGHITGPIRQEFAAFLDAEEELYREGVESAHLLHNVATGTFLIELLLVTIVLVRFRRLSRGQAAELTAQNQQLRVQATDLEEQAVELEQQTQEAQELALELEMANEDLKLALEEARSAQASEIEALREREDAFAQLDAALGSAPVGFAFYDLDLRYVRVNPAHAALSGLSARDHVGKSIRETLPALAPTVLPVLEKVRATGEAVLDVEVRGPTPSRDQPRSFVASYYPIRREARELVGIGVVVTETTALKELEAQLRQSQKMEAVGQLAGGIAHDFNNMLTAIMSFAELLLADMPSGSPHRADVEEIQSAARRAAALTRQLLAFSRKQLLQPVPLDLNAVVQGLEEMLRRLLGEDVDLVARLDATLHSAIADPGQIEQIVMNLAVNARDAMPEGGRLTIETANAEIDDAYARRAGELQPGPYVVLSVSDTGTGMDAETQAKIFEPFFTTKEAGRGTGLGLSTVYGIVKQSGGHVTVYSEPGQGTTFRIYLPRAITDAALAKESGGVAIPLPRGTETILLVEDDPAVRLVASRILVRQGYRVLEAPAPAEARALVARHAGVIDLVMTDLVLPGMSGRELAEILLGVEPHMRVLYMSGYTDDAVIRRGLLEPGMAFLSKPFTVEEIARMVRATLDGKRTSKRAVRRTG